MIKKIDLRGPGGLVRVYKVFGVAFILYIKYTQEGIAIILYYKIHITYI